MLPQAGSRGFFGCLCHLQKGALVRVVLHVRIRAFYSVNPSLLVLFTSSVALQISASMGSSEAERENWIPSLGSRASPLHKRDGVGS